MLTESAKHTLKLWLAIGPIMLTVLGMLIGLGFCTPGVQTTGDAIRAQSTLKAELAGQVKVLSELSEKREDLNRQTHDKIFTELKEQRDLIRVNQIEIMRELRGVGSAPSGQQFKRGVPIK